MKTFAQTAARRLGLNLLVVATIGTAVFAVHVNTDRHTDPSISQHIVAPTWQN